MGKPRRGVRRPKPTGDGNPYGGREIRGDELRAAQAARAFATRLEAEIPRPAISDEISAQEFVSAFHKWRAALGPTAESLRKKRTAAINAAKAIDLVTALAATDAFLLPELVPLLSRARAELAVYETFTAYAMQIGLGKGATKANKSDQAIQAAAFLLYCKGLSRTKIAKLLGKDRRQVVLWLAGARPIVDDMREFLGLRKREDHS